MKLSKYFTLDELTISDFASRNGINNGPLGDELKNLQDTAMRMDEVRQYLGQPIMVTSGFRCALVNAAIGGSVTSDHCHGLAVDFTCPGFGSVTEVFDKLRYSKIIRFDQLIHEFGSWVHIGFGPRMRGQVLRAGRVDGHVVYTEVK